VFNKISMLGKQLALACITLAAAALIIFAGYRGISSVGQELTIYSNWTEIDSTMQQRVVMNLLKANNKIHIYMHSPNQPNYIQYARAMSKARGGFSRWAESVKDHPELLEQGKPVAERIKGIESAMAKYRNLVRDRKRTLVYTDNLAQDLSKKLRQSVTMVISPERQFSQADGDMEAVVRWYNMQVILEEKIAGPVNKAVAGIHEYVYSSDAKLLNAIENDLAMAGSGLFEWEDAVAGNKELEQTSKQLGDILKGLKKNLDKLTEISKQEVVIRKQINDNSQAATDAVESLISKFIAPAKAEAVESANQAESAALVGMGVMAAIAAGISLLASLFFALSVSRSLRKAERFAQSVAEGDLNAELDVHRGDEIGRIATAISRIPHNLKQVLGDFEHVAENIREGRLNTRGDETKFQGAYAEMIENANGMADTLIGLLDDLPLPVMAVDTDKNIIYMNKLGAQQGEAEPDALVGAKCFEHFRTTDCNTEDCACLKAINGDEVSRSNAEARPDAGRMDIEYIGTPIHDEHGKVVGAFKIIMDQTSIKDAQKRMMESADRAEEIVSNLSSAAEQLTVQMEQIKRGAANQKSMSAEAASAMEQMSSTVIEIARNASDAAENAANANQHATDGGQVVKQVVSAIQEVQHRADAMDSSIKDLGVKVENIGDIMNVINDIADQTNLLALNAAIEAARAGEAGRGFAVVADEVRKLAEKTMQATGEVETAVSSIRTGAEQNATAIREAVTAVGQATELADNAGEALSSIVGIVATTDDRVRNIATAAEEQSATSEEVTRTVANVDEQATEMDEAMSQSASAVADLARLAAEVRTLVEELKA
jgi:methyl-accepting chemotaxis protein